MKHLFGLLLLIAFAAPLHAQAVFQVAGAIAGIDAGVSASITATLPAHIAGDVCVARYYIGGDATVSVPPAGWTQLWTQLATEEEWGYWKRATSSAETNPVFTTASTNFTKKSVAYCFRGAEPSGDPFDVVNTPDTHSGDDTTPGITTLAANDLVILFYTDRDDTLTAVAVTATNPAAITSRDYQEELTGINDILFNVASANRTTAGATGTITIDVTGTSNGGRSVVVALTSAIPGGVLKYYRSKLEPSNPVEATPPTIEHWRDQIRSMQGLQAVALTKLGRLNEALDIHRELALRADTPYEVSQSWNNVGAILWDKQDYDGAANAFNIAAMADHGYFWAYDALINSVHRRHFYNRSAPITAPALELSEKTYGFFGPAYTAGKFAFLDGRFALAARYLWWAVPLAQNQSKYAQIATHLYLAEALGALGRTEAARYHVREAMRRDPTFEPSVAAEARLGLRNL